MGGAASCGISLTLHKVGVARPVAESLDVMVCGRNGGCLWMDSPGASGIEERSVVTSCGCHLTDGMLEEQNADSLAASAGRMLRSGRAHLPSPS